MGLKAVELSWNLIVVFSCLFLLIECQRLKADIRHDPKHNVTRIDMGLEASIHLYRQWQDQAISGLMAAIASKKISKVSREDASSHEKCAKSANSVIKHAKCVSELLQKPQIISSHAPPSRDTRTLFSRLKPQLLHQPAKPLEQRAPDNIIHESIKSTPKSKRFEKLSKRRNRNPQKSSQQWREEKKKSIEVKARKKRYIFKTAKNYHLQDPHSKMSPLGLIAKQLTQKILNAKNKSSASSWQSLIAKAQETSIKKRNIKKSRQKQIPSNSMEDSNFGIFGSKNQFQHEDLDEILEDKIKRKKLFRQMRREKFRTPEKKIAGLLREGMKLGYSILGKNMTNFDEKNLKVMSPRLFSVTENEEDEDMIDILSPSLLNFHGNGSGLERDLSLPNLVKGFTTADQQQWLDLIFEASGVEDSLKQAEEALIAQEFQAREKRSYEQRMRGPDGEPLYFTKDKAIETLGDPEAKRIAVSEALTKSYTKSQMKEMNETGFVVLTQEQLHLVYGQESPYANPKMIEVFSNMSKQEIHNQIEMEILNLREYSYKDIKDLDLMGESRHKRAIIASPIIGSTVAFDPSVPSQPIILSPILFTTVVGSPALFGPITLSPWVFLPVILSPRTLSPPILSPLLFVPVVLSPITLHPVILCPGIFVPVVLSPITLSPFILSPQVFTPIILSPLVLSPFILNPSVASPLILSPFVLNPVIYSPLALTALILSPNALSPVVKSPLFSAEIILSPSFLS